MLKAIAIAAILLGSAPVLAATTIYNVNQSIGFGSVTGTIQTNGTLGLLTQSDITGFNLTVTGPGASVQLSQADSVIVTQGSNLSATSSALLFDYSGPSGYLLFQLGSFGTGMKYYCNSSVLGDCFQGASAVPESFNSASAQVEARVGTQIIATASVPEPATWALMIGGFIIVGTAMRRRLASSRAPAA